MSARLTASYRSWVRWYPASWRAVNAEAMLGVYLDIADEQGRNRLTASEKRSLFASGLATRFSALLPARVRDGVATGAIALLGALGAVLVFFFEWAPFWSSGSRNAWRAMTTSCLDAGFDINACGGDGSSVFGPFASTVGVVASLAVITAGLAFLGRLKLTRALLALTAAAGVASAIVAHTPLFSAPARPPYIASLFFTIVALAALIGRPSGRRRLSIAIIGWIFGFMVVLETSGGWFNNDRVYAGTGASGFFLGLTDRTTVANCIALALLGAIVLMLARRTTAALVVAASTVLWLPIWFYGVVVSNHLGFEPRGSELLMVLGYIVVGALVAGRRLGTRAESSART